MRKRDLWIILGALCLALALSAHVLFNDVMSTASWGLSFQTQGKPPSGPASAAQLSKYDAAYLGQTTQKVLYLTFDAGYENGCTAKILDVLRQHNVPAAFFLVGNYMERNPDLVRRMVAEGHTVGNHTMHHKDMSKLTDPAVFRQELQDLEVLYKQVVGEPLPKYYRPPQGIYSEENLRMAQELGYKTVFWSFAYADWDNDKQMAPDAALERILAHVHNGAVLLLHPTSATNAAILGKLIETLRTQGYRFGTLDELCGTK